MLSVTLSPSIADAFNVMDFGAKADGKTDDTDAFNRALTAAAKIPGSTVHAPGGKYLIAGQVTVHFYTTLQGDYTGTGMHDGGTIILATGFKGKTEGGCCLGTAGKAVIRGFRIDYPEQDANASEPDQIPLRDHCKRRLAH